MTVHTVTSLANQLGGLNARQIKAVSALETAQREFDHLVALAASGENPTSYENGKVDLEVARKLLADATSAWKRAKAALMTSKDVKTATTEYETALTCTEQAEAILNPPVLVSIVLSDDPAPLTETPIDPVPVAAPSSARATKTKAEKEPKPAPAKPDSELDAALKVLLDPEKGVQARLTAQSELIAALTERVEAVEGSPVDLTDLTRRIRAAENLGDNALIIALIDRLRSLEDWRDGGIGVSDLGFLKGRQNRFNFPNRTNRNDPATH